MATIRATSRPRVLFLAAALIGLEALVAAGYGVIEASQTHRSRLVVGLGAAALLLGYGALLLAVARGAWRGCRWSRGPGVATQLIQVLLGWSLRQGESLVVALALVGVALVVLGCLLAPAATAVFLAQPEAGGDADHRS